MFKLQVSIVFLANHTIFEMLKDSKSGKTGARNGEIGSAKKQSMLKARETVQQMTN